MHTHSCTHVRVHTCTHTHTAFTLPSPPQTNPAPSVKPWRALQCWMRPPPCTPTALQTLRVHTFSHLAGEAEPGGWGAGFVFVQASVHCSFLGAVCVLGLSGRPCPSQCSVYLLAVVFIQYFGHLMQITDSLEKTLMLGKIEGRRRRGAREVRAS